MSCSNIYERRLLFIIYFQIIIYYITLLHDYMLHFELGYYIFSLVNKN